MRDLTIPLMMMCLAVVMVGIGIKKELKEIKHQVNEVICVALEMEETNGL